MRLFVVLMLLVASGCGSDDGDGAAPLGAERLWVVATTGFLTDPPATLLFSDDTGATWRTAFTSAHALRGLAFTPDRRGAAVGTGLTLFTHDGGTHWTTSRAVADERLYAVALAGDGRGLAVGATLDPGNIIERAPLALTTEDAGAHWHVDTLPAQVADVTSTFGGACFTDSGDAIVIGTSGAGVLRRDDAGWTDVSAGFQGIVADVFCRGTSVWLGGTRLTYSGDGGRTWEDRTAALDMPSFFVEHVAFADDLHGWVLGALPVRLTPSTTLHIALVVLATSDGGTTWQKVAVGEQPIGGWAGGVATSVAGPGALAGGSPFTSSMDPFAIALDTAGGRRLGLPAGFDGVAAVAVSRR